MRFLRVMTTHAKNELPDSRETLLAEIGDRGRATFAVGEGEADGNVWASTLN